MASYLLKTGYTETLMSVVKQTVLTSVQINLCLSKS